MLSSENWPLFSVFYTSGFFRGAGQATCVVIACVWAPADTAMIVILLAI